MGSLENNENGNQKRSKVWILDQKLDHPMDNEAVKLKNMQEEKKFSTLLLLQLAFQSLGVVYGDLGTSPLYVFYNIFPDGIQNPDDVIEVLSLIIYSLILIPLVKYVFIVCRANDNGQGGTFALYSLLCRHANVKTIPDQDHTDEQLTTYTRSTFDESSFAGKTKRWLEGNAFRKKALLVLVLVGSCLVIGDAIMTPAISVLSAVDGFKLSNPKMTYEVVKLISVAVIVCLFCAQHHGIDRITWLLAPVMLLWFLLIGGIGIFNIWRYDSSILKAFSPVYIYMHFKRGAKNARLSLGGVVLGISGTEALFADLSHFPVLSIQIAFVVIAFPCLLFAYCGQAAYLMKNPEHVFNVFYLSTPDGLFWPVLLVAIAAAVAASQATISLTFSFIKQALALSCFPRVKVVHTSKKFLNQIYIPDINWLLMILCIVMTLVFRNLIEIGNASGVIVVGVMLVTTLLMILIMLLVWHCHWILVLIFAGLSLIIEGTYFYSILFKINQGGWIPLIIAAAIFVILYVWHYGTMKRYEFELHSKVSMAWILGLGNSLGLVRIPGIGLIYTELASGVPRIFSHFVTNLPAIHSVVIFVCVKHLPVYTVPEEERFLVGRIGPKNYHMFRCVARYGYKDLHKKDDDFEKKLFDSLFSFVRQESSSESGNDYNYSLQTGQSMDEPWNNNGNILCSKNVDATFASMDSIVTINSSLPGNNTIISSSQAINQIDELDFLTSCRDAGVVHLLGNTVVTARKDSKLFNKIAIDYVYAFLRKICRENSAIFKVPHENLLSVGQIIQV